MKKAWLVTWIGTGKHAEWEGKVVSLLNYRLSDRAVADYMERHWIDSFGSPSERLAYAKSKKNTPYPAQFDTVEVDGKRVPYEGRMYCGPNPFLYGRLVQNIHVEVDEDGNEQLKWDDIPRPKPGERA